MQRDPTLEHSSSFTPTGRSKVRRLAMQGSYERDLIYKILDDGLIAQIYIHGSPISRMMRSLVSAIEVCITVTLLDGLVLARSTFHHSMHYRSVMIFGTATVSELEQKRTALQEFTEQIVPGQ